MYPVCFNAYKQAITGCMKWSVATRGLWRAAHHNNPLIVTHLARGPSGTIPHPDCLLVYNLHPPIRLRPEQWTWGSGGSGCGHHLTIPYHTIPYHTIPYNHTTPWGSGSSCGHHHISPLVVCTNTSKDASRLPRPRNPARGALESPGIRTSGEEFRRCPRPKVRNVPV